MKRLGSTELVFFDWESIIDWEMIGCEFNHAYNYHCSLYRKGDTICDVGIKFRELIHGHEPDNIKVIVTFYVKGTNCSVILEKEFPFTTTLNNIINSIKRFIKKGLSDLNTQMESVMRTEDILYEDLNVYIAAVKNLNYTYIVHHYDEELDDEAGGWVEVVENNGNNFVWEDLPDYSTDSSWTGLLLSEVIEHFIRVDISKVEFGHRESEMCIHLPNEGVYVRGLDLGECVARTYLYMIHGVYTDEIKRQHTNGID